MTTANAGPDHCYSGRSFTEHEIAWIRELIVSCFELNRVQLSNRVCDELAWLRPNGQRRDMSCRVAMLRMARDGLISLPAPKNRNKNGRYRPPITDASDAGSPVTRPAGELGSLSVDRVESRNDSRLYNELVERYHYLGYKPLPGAQLRYMVRGSHGLLAVLGFGAASWALEARDRFIGWTREQRIESLHLVVNNARFLILPWVQSKNLASRILGAVQRRLQEDWRIRYGYSPVLLETCVLKDRYRGTCYRAANWVHVGETKGRGKKDHTHKQVLPIKDIFVYPMAKEFRARLRSGHAEPFPARARRVGSG